MTSGWQTIALGQLCSIKSGKSDTKDAVKDGEYAFFDRSRTIKKSTRYLYDCEALIIPGEGTEFLPRHFIGKFDLHQRAYALFDFSNRIDVRFLYNFLHHKSEYFPQVAVGATVKSLRLRHFEQLPVSLTTIPEQKRIVGILDEAFDGIATVKANAEKNLQNARALFESHLQSVFTQRGPGWVEKLLEELGTITSSKRIFKSEYVESGVPFYRTKEIKQLANGRDITTELFISAARYKEIKTGFGVPQEGDILLTAIGTIGEIWVVEGDNDFYFKDGNVLWLKEFTSINPGFLRYVLVSFVESLNKMAHGSAYSALPIQRLNAHRIFLPSKAEQEDIVPTLDSLDEETQRLARLYERNLVLLEALKKSLLHEAFTGQL